MKSKLPDCQLVEILRSKADARTDIQFDYIGELEKFRRRIGGEVRFINQLFPEYTPHDEEYHLSRLFHVADTLIERERYEIMNATELFVLACGLYGHDWGMAVSAVEKDYIVSANVPDGRQASEFALLHNETKLFEKFIKDLGLEISEVKRNGISNEDWREYVRKTHAFRSGQRVRHHFQNIDSGVGEAAGRVCEGHWLNIEDLQDSHRYPVNFAVLRENVDVAAVAVYVRLVDLLDIGHDRTPYVIWKFVAPRDRLSKLEWNKHRALQPVTCPSYLKGRIVLVDGSTDDHEVYAALEDLRAYCEKQVRECSDLLAQLGDPKHVLDIYHVQWRVVPRGFDPILVRFEFERASVFEILSSEIYQNDPYVFLRELLQNSIDAIRMRRELLERRGGIKLNNFGLITVEIHRGSGGDARIIWTDDGVGMDAYIIRNYLAVAGRSYYRSEDFERQGLNLDPISRFGVGLLSCFMVADTVEIETCRDPYASSSTDALKIRIPSITRQFRIERTSPLEFGFGTRITVYVEGRRLPEGVRALDVVEYLRSIAGFVEFPILISDEGAFSLVLHPASKIDPNTDPRLRTFSNVKCHRLQLGYPFEEAILPQDFASARVELSEVRFNLADDFGLDEFEGEISYLEIREGDYRIDRNDKGGGDGFELCARDQEEGLNIRWQRNWSASYWSREKKGSSKSANSALTHSIYRDGILVSGASLPGDYEDNRRLGRHGPLPRVVVNLPSVDITQLDIARSEVRTTGEHWFDLIKKKLLVKLRPQLLSNLMSVPPEVAFSKLGLFCAIYGIETGLFSEEVLSELPLGVLLSDGTFGPRRWKDLEANRIPVGPAVLTEEFRLLVESEILRKEYGGPLNYWAGGDVVIRDVDYLSDIRFMNGITVTKFLIDTLCVLSSIEFLIAPKRDMPPLVQEIWRVKNPDFSGDIRSIAEQAVMDPASLSADEIDLLCEKAPRRPLEFVAFPAGAKTAFRVGYYLFNLNHPVARLLLQAKAYLILNTERADADLGRFAEAVGQLGGIHSSKELRRLTEAATAVISLAPKVGLKTESRINPQITQDELWHRSAYDFSHSLQGCKQRFGQPMKS